MGGVDAEELRAAEGVDRRGRNVRRERRSGKKSSKKSGKNGRPRAR